MAVVTVKFMAKSLMRTVTVQAIIPVDKLTFPGMPEPEKKPFKTLYLLHGVFGSDIDWLYGTRIQRFAEKNNLAVIMPAGENGFYSNHPGSGANYSDFIGKELVEVTRDLFPLSREREDTFIGGLSMGGFGCIVNGLRHSDTFGCVTALSSALIKDTIVSAQYHAPSFLSDRAYFESLFGDTTKYDGGDYDYYALVEKGLAEGKNLPKFYLCCGTEDGLITANRAYRDFLIEKGLDVTYEEGPGGHDWDFWDRYIQKIIDWLPLDRGVEGINSGNVGKTE